jgi:hypothetical protein
VFGCGAVSGPGVGSGHPPVIEEVPILNWTPNTAKKTWEYNLLITDRDGGLERPELWRRDFVDQVDYDSDPPLAVRQLSGASWESLIRLSNLCETPRAGDTYEDGKVHFRAFDQAGHSTLRVLIYRLRSNT